MPNNKHILVVEDEEHLAVGIKYNLEAEGYRVTTVRDGPSALKILDQTEQGTVQVDLVILDLMLPGMSGYAVCETLRDRNKGMPVLILSARTRPGDRTRGFDVGANQYMSKPFDLGELLSRVKNLLGLSTRGGDAKATEAEELTTFEFDGARIDFQTHEVTVRGKSVRLTRLELDLLRYFIQHAGRVISRQELLENVWQMPGYMHTRAPDQFIRRLRKTFEPDPAEPRHFLTLRDTGYRFVPHPQQPSE